MKFILGKKQHMIQYFTDDGRAVPATLISLEPLTVTQVKSTGSDGYSAVQVGYGTQKKERVSKSVLGHTKDHGVFSGMKEFRIVKEDSGSMNLGDKIDGTIFTKGDIVRVTGISKGKGFQGVVKRHGFHGGPRSHGQKHSEREPGSIGGGLRTRVPKGMRMAGRTGSDKVTIKNLVVLDVDSENNQILIKGAVPGRKGTLVRIIG